jgi:archaellum component FlaC
MTEDRRLTAEDRRRRAGETAIIGRPLSAFRHLSWVGVLALLPLLFATGCRNRALEQAQQDSRDARVTIEKLKASVNAAAREIATVKEELSSVRQNRDELQKQVEQLLHERDQASTFAQQAQEAISKLTTQETGQRSVTAALEKQISELNTLVEDQRKLIEQLKGSAAQPATTTAPAADKPATADPNEKP